MKLSNKKKVLTPCLTMLLNNITRSCSSVPALVAFKLKLNGKTLEPTGANDAKSISPFDISKMHTKEITFESIAYTLINSEIDLIDLSSASKIKLGNDITAYCKTIYINNQKDISKFSVESTAEVFSRQLEFDLNGEIDTMILELLFVSRCDIDSLPEEFKGFLKYNSWLTLGSSYTSVANISFESTNETDFIEIKPKYEDALKFIREDLKDVITSLSL